jgi:acetyl-CoA carboxylase biotin carboxyl carrier protein
MNQKEIRELIDFLIEKDIAEFELERGDVKLRVKRGNSTSVTQVVAVPAAAAAPLIAHAPAAAPAHSAPAAPPPAAPASAPAAPEPTSEEAELVGAHIIKSPIVGTFYESPSPGAPPFVKPGDPVSVGQVLCIVEAMKLMNEIESDYSGTIIKRFVNNGQPVEYGQQLFAVKP